MTSQVTSAPATKPWYQSKGVIGGVVTVVGLVATLFFHKQLSAMDQTDLTNDLIGAGTIAASLVALYGRLFAKHILTATKQGT